jgi:hypothetical protein
MVLKEQENYKLGTGPAGTAELYPSIICENPSGAAPPLISVAIFPFRFVPGSGEKPIPRDASVPCDLSDHAELILLEIQQQLSLGRTCGIHQGFKAVAFAGSSIFHL